MDYTVNLAIDIYAATPEDAVREFIKWMEEDGVRQWVYGVESEDGTLHTVDALTL